jgi:hypothetical protein
MSVDFVVDPAVLVAAGGSLHAIGSETSVAASRIRSADGLAEPAMAAGVAAVAGAWGGAVELLGSTTGVLGALVERAAAGYAGTDHAIAGGVAAR